MLRTEVKCRAGQLIEWMLEEGGAGKCVPGETNPLGESVTGRIWRPLWGLDMGAEGRETHSVLPVIQMGS